MYPCSSASQTHTHTKSIYHCPPLFYLSLRLGMCAEAWQHSFPLSFFDKTLRGLLKIPELTNLFFSFCLSFFFFFYTQLTATSRSKQSIHNNLLLCGDKGPEVHFCVSVCKNKRALVKIQEREPVWEKMCIFNITARKSFPSVRMSPCCSLRVSEWQRHEYKRHDSKDVKASSVVSAFNLMSNPKLIKDFPPAYRKISQTTQIENPKRAWSWREAACAISNSSSASPPPWNDPI